MLCPYLQEQCIHTQIEDIKHWTPYNLQKPVQKKQQKNKKKEPKQTKNW